MTERQLQSNSDSIIVSFKVSYFFFQTFPLLFLKVLLVLFVLF